jgi:hypothetical protein
MMKDRYVKRPLSIEGSCKTFKSSFFLYCFLVLFNFVEVRILEYLNSTDCKKSNFLSQENLAINRRKLIYDYNPSFNKTQRIKFLQ